MRKITFRSIYDVNSRKFNVTSNGVTIERDVNGKPYITGSADNVKHCVLNLIMQEGGYKKMERVFEKKIDKKEGLKKLAQGGLLTKIDLFNPMATFGAWDSSVNAAESKYKGIAIKSSVNFGYFTPLSTELSTITNQVHSKGTINGAEGVCVGDDSDLLEFVGDKDKRYTTPQELANDGLGSIEECVAAFNNERKLNLYEKSPLANGLYVFECEIDMDTFGRYRLYDLKRSEEQCQEFLDKGWKIVTIDNQTYLEAPADERKRLFASLVKAIHDFEFMTNNSAAGNPLKLVRTSFGYRNAQKVAMATDYDKFSKDILINDNINGVQSFNTHHLRQWVDVKENNISVDYNAIDNSIEKMIELGNYIIDE